MTFILIAISFNNCNVFYTLVYVLFSDIKINWRFYLGNILKHWYKYAFVSLIFWAAIVGYSRIYVGKHYPGDVITGIIIGALLGFGFYKLQQYLVKRFA